MHRITHIKHARANSFEGPMEINRKLIERLMSDITSEDAVAAVNCRLSEILPSPLAAPEITKTASLASVLLMAIGYLMPCEQKMINHVLKHFLPTEPLAAASPFFSMYASSLLKSVFFDSMSLPMPES